MSFKSLREMWQMGKDLWEIHQSGEDFRKFYRSRSRIELTTISTADQRITSKKEVPMKSHLKGLMAFIYAHHTNVLFTGVYNTAGTISNTILGGYSVQTTSADSGVGIQVGSNSDSQSLVDFSLNTLIPHGTTPGSQELSYSATTMSLLTNSASGVWSFTMDRDFENLQGTTAGGGITVTVRETGFVINDGTKNFLGERTLIGPFPVSNDLGDPDNFHEKLNVLYKELVTV